MSSPSEPDTPHTGEILNQDQDNNDHSSELLRLAQLAGFQLGILGDESIIDLPSLDATPLLPGCCDLMVEKVERIGHRGDYPMPKEWENLLALLEPGHELLWVITKRPEEGFSYHVAVKTNGALHLNPEKTKELKAAFRSNVGQFTKRSYPESITKVVQTDEILRMVNGILDHSNGEVIVTSGYPSANDIEDNREFPEPGRQNPPDGSLNDIVEPFTSENSFSIIFTVGRAGANVANERLTQMLDLRSVISPHLKVQRGENESDTEAKSTGKQTSTGINLSQSENRGKIATMFQSIFGSKAGAIREFSVADSGKNDHAMLVEAMLKSRSVGSTGGWWSGSNASLQKTATESVTDNITISRQTGTSTTLTHSNALVEHVDQKLQESIRSLKKAIGTGAYFMAAEVFSPNTELSLRIARSISGSLAGAKTHVRPFQTAVYRGDGFGDHLLTTATIDTLYPAIAVESRHVAAQFLPVPEADLPGLRTKRNVFYGKPNAAQQKDGENNKQSTTSKIWLGDLSHLWNGISSSEDRAFLIESKALTSHLLIAGTTGSGKTQRAAAILNRLPTDKYRIVVIESAKKTYRKLLHRKGVSPKILSLGETGASALRINPFYFEPGTSLKRHISIFSDALADLLPVEALIGPKLREAIQRCYIRYQWDIETGVYKGETGKGVYPTMVDLHMEAFSLAKSLNYGPEMKSNYQGALLGRSRLFIDELYQDIFGWGGSQPLEKLFGEDDVIIEMDSLPPSEAKMPSFVLSLLLERMRSWQQRELQQSQEKGAPRPRDIILVIEEAHNLLEKSLEGQQSSQEMGSGRFLLKQIVRLLQEGREAGIGVIVVDQSPASLADAVVRNTNTKIILRITDAEEAEKIGSTLGLTKEECRDLHELEDGESVVKVKNAGRALKLSPLDQTELAGSNDDADAGRTQKIEPSTCDKGGTAPDYYRASKTIFEIAGLVQPGGSYLTESKLKSAVDELETAAGGNEEAGRFFRQKMLATVTEKMDADLRSGDNTCPSFAELPLLLCKRVNSKSFEVLKQQLKCLFSGIPWNEARQFFEVSCMTALPLLGRYLEDDFDWKIMGGASGLIDLLAILNNPSSEEVTKDDSYSNLQKIIRGSRERNDTIRNLILIN